MKKLAIFVEGQTEWLFVEKLLRKIVSSKRLSITVARGIGGEKRARRFEVIKKTEPMITQRFYVQINISAADSRVNSDVWENYSALVAARFEGIVVVRDVPTGLAFYRIPALRKGESFNLKLRPIRVLFILAIMEIEAWFLAEHTHFCRIHPRLTLPRIKKVMGFDPSTDDMQLRPRTHEDLSQIYGLENIEYAKRKQEVQKTVAALDYGLIQTLVGPKFSDLQDLINKLKDFLS